MAFAGIGYVLLLVLPPRIVHRLAFMMCPCVHVCVCVCMRVVFSHYPSLWTIFTPKYHVSENEILFLEQKFSPLLT